MTGPEALVSPPPDTRWGFARLTKRAQFQRVAKGRRGNARCVALQAATSTDDAEPRIGLTITRKVGGSVERNRIRRRLRAALKLAAGNGQRQGHDYVVVARREALQTPFPELCSDLAKAFERVHQARERGAGPSRKKPGSPPSRAPSNPSEPLAV